MAHTNPLLLSDAALEECVDGSTSVDLLREILRQPSVVQRNRKVSAKQFAEQFQMALEDYSEDEDANENNYQWGLSIAESINDATEQPIAYAANPQSAWPKH
jgi:hypothetical protein